MIPKSQLKLFKSLAYKKYRNETGLFVIEGRKMVEEAINSNPPFYHKPFRHFCSAKIEDQRNGNRPKQHST